MVVPAAVMVAPAAGTADAPSDEVRLVAGGSGDQLAGGGITVVAAASEYPAPTPDPDADRGRRGTDVHPGAEIGHRQLDAAADVGERRHVPGTGGGQSR